MGKKARRKLPQRPRPPPHRPSHPGESADSEKGAIADPESVAAAAPPPAAAAESEASDGKIDDPIKCRHFKRGLNLEKLEEKLTSFATAALVCPTCLKGGRRAHSKLSVGKKKKQHKQSLKKSHGNAASATLWICLACGNVGCENSHEQDEEEHQAEKIPFGPGHAIEHSRQQRHPLALQCGDELSVYCFDCGSMVAGAVDLVNEVDSSGPKSRSLQQAAQVVQESYFRRRSKEASASVREMGEGVVEVDEDGEPKNVSVRGLQNLGNTCFFNSVMQSLSSVRRLRDYFLGGVVAASEGPLTSALRRFFQEFKEVDEQQQQQQKGNWREKGCYNPKGLFGAVCSHSSRFSGFQQQDSHELLRCLLDGLHVEEEKSVRNDRSERPAVKVDTIVEKFFGGEFSSTVSCCECGFSSSVSEPFLDLSLPLPAQEGEETKHAPSKREMKGKKKVWEGKKRGGPMVKPAVEPAVKSSQTVEAGKSEVDDALSWLDYVEQDFVDVSLAEPEEQLLQVTDTTATALGTSEATDMSAAALVQDTDASATEATDSSAAVLVSATALVQDTDASTTEATDSSAAVLVSATALVQDTDASATEATESSAAVLVSATALVQDTDASATEATDSSAAVFVSATALVQDTNASATEATDSSGAVLVHASDISSVASVQGTSSAVVVQATETEGALVPETSSITGTSAAEVVKVSNTSAFQISTVELQKALGELLPLTDGASSENPTFALHEGWDGVADSEPVVVGGAEDKAILLPSNDEVEEALCSAPAVIALPYWEDQASSSGWEVLTSTGDTDVGDGIAGLFQEEEDVTTGVVMGCANRDGAGPGPVEEEEIIEKSIAPMTLEGCLLAFTKLEVLTGDNAWGCANCSKQEAERADEQSEDKDWNTPDDDDEEEKTGSISSDFPKVVGESNSKPEKGSDDRTAVRRNATKRLVIKKAPPVLTVHLKRFAQDFRGKLSKLTGHVAFEEVLDLNQFQSSRDSTQSCVYRLVGVVEHSGTMKGGHYVAYVRAEAPGSKSSFWYLISDSNVRRTTLELVLRSEAYLLFYERV